MCCVVKPAQTACGKSPTQSKRAPRHFCADRTEPSPILLCLSRLLFTFSMLLSAFRLNTIRQAHPTLHCGQHYPSSLEHPVRSQQGTWGCGSPSEVTYALP